MGEPVPAIRTGSWAGYRVAVWYEPGLAHALVADLPDAFLARLARLCIAQMMANVRELLATTAARPLG